MLDMPKVTDCNVEKCAYNREMQCRAMAINVGGSGPICEAFVTASAKCGSPAIIAGVGACKVKDCRFNDCLMCTASGINVQTSGTQAMCKTFNPR